MNTTNTRKKLFITTQWGKMRICPDCPEGEYGDDHWFTDQFNGRTCRACFLEVLEKKRRAQGMKKGRGGVPTLDARESDELCARYRSGGITQQDLSEQFGISRRTVARILSGETRAGQAA